MFLNEIKMTKRIAFLSPTLTITGPTVALYDYADCNETMLNNKSLIITRTYETTIDDEDTRRDVYETFQNRFPIIYYDNPSDIDRIVSDNKIDILYILKHGSDTDMLMTSKCKCCIHCMDNSSTSHGDVYAVVGPAVNSLCDTTCPIVPPMIRISDWPGNLRQQLGIPTECIVFGRYGPYKGFDIQFVKEYINECNDSNIVFLFMNTEPFTANPRVVYLNGSFDMRVKKLFINTCDALLHAHERGETFGLTCGEFSLAGKHVITYASSKATTHLQLLGNRAMTYRNKIELDYIIGNFSKIKSKYSTDPATNLYHKALTPENVMRIFNRTFIGKDDET